MHLSVLRHESMANLKGIVQQKDHFAHRSPLAVQDDRERRRHNTWSKSFSKLPFISSSSRSEGSKTPKVERPLSSVLGDFEAHQPRKRESSIASISPKHANTAPLPSVALEDDSDYEGSSSETDEDDVDLRDDQKPIGSRVKYWEEAERNKEANAQLQTQAPQVQKRAPAMGTRLTMTSRSACFNDRILNAPMMRSMALCCEFTFSMPYESSIC